MILWHGLIQVRVKRCDPDTGHCDDLWFDTLEKGACFSVYTAFNKDWYSLVSLKASAKNTVVF